MATTINLNRAMKKALISVAVAAPAIALLALPWDPALTQTRNVLQPVLIGLLCPTLWLLWVSRKQFQMGGLMVALMIGAGLVLLSGLHDFVMLRLVGDISARTYLWFTAKTAPSRQADSAARIQITEAGGLTIVNGEAYATAADGSLTVDEVAETVTIVLAADVTAVLSAGQRMEWDLQILDADGRPETIATGTLTVTTDVTRATEEPT
jgi:hypothetical protein